MPVELIRKNSPLIVTLPYTGVNMPRALVQRLADQKQFFAAPDRFLLRLLSGDTHAASLLQANFHRFLSDVDHAQLRSDEKPNSGMLSSVPLLDRDGGPVWNLPPGPREARSWRAMYYAPYHAALAAEIARTRAEFGHAIVLNLRARHTPFDCAPDGPDYFVGFGNRNGTSCNIDLSVKIINILKSHKDFSPKFNRDVYAGGTVKRYGKPQACTHAVEMELSEACYLTTTDDVVLFDAHKAAPLRHLLDDVICYLSQWRPT